MKTKDQAPGTEGLKEAAREICDFMDWPEDGPAWDDALTLAGTVHKIAYMEGWNDREDDLIVGVNRLGAPAQEPPPAEGGMERIHEVLAEGDSCWRPCSGCYETSEGYDVGPISPVFKSHMGGGCSECGGLGVIWDNTDYGDMADFILADEATIHPPAEGGGETAPSAYDMAAAKRALARGDASHVVELAELAEYHRKHAWTWCQIARAMGYENGGRWDDPPRGLGTFVEGQIKKSRARVLAALSSGSPPLILGGDGGSSPAESVSEEPDGSFASDSSRKSEEGRPPLDPPKRFSDNSPLRVSERRVLELLWWRRDMHMHEGRGQRYTPLTEDEKSLLSGFIDFVYDDIADMIDEAATQPPPLDEAAGTAPGTPDGKE